MGLEAEAMQGLPWGVFPPAPAIPTNQPTTPLPWMFSHNMLCNTASTTHTPLSTSGLTLSPSPVEILELLLNPGTQTFSPREFLTGKSPSHWKPHSFSAIILLTHQ